MEIPFDVTGDLASDSAIRRARDVYRYAMTIESG